MRRWLQYGVGGGLLLGLALLAWAQLQTSNVPGIPAGGQTGPRCIQLNESGRMFSCSYNLVWDEAAQTFRVTGNLAVSGSIDAESLGGGTVSDTPNRCGRFNALGVLDDHTGDCFPKSEVFDRDPDVTDDSSQGWAELSYWLNGNTGVTWQLCDAQVGAAVWEINSCGSMAATIPTLREVHANAPTRSDSVMTAVDILTAFNLCPGDTPREQCLQLWTTFLGSVMSFPGHITVQLASSKHFELRDRDGLLLTQWSGDSAYQGMTLPVGGAAAANPGADKVGLFIDNVTNRTGGGASDCALVARLGNGFEVVVSVLVPDGECP